MAKTGASRTVQQRELDLTAISRLYLQQKPQSEIANLLGISQAQVSLDLKKLLKRWEESRFQDIDRYKFEQLERINLIESEMWQAWEKSKIKGNLMIERSKSGDYVKEFDVASGKTIKTDVEKRWKAMETEEKSSGGDYKYMEGIQWCVQERSKIMGLNSPKKIAVTDPTGTKEAGVSAREEMNMLLDSVIEKLTPKKLEEGDIIDVEIIEDEDPVMRIPVSARLLSAKNDPSAEIIEEEYLESI